MQHDLSHYRDGLLTVHCYCPNNAINSSVSWLAQRNGDILINPDTKQNAVLSVVGRVLDNHLDCSVLGNHGNRPAEKLPSVKYHLLLGKPTDTVFADNFETTLDNLSQIEKKMASSAKYENLIVYERGVRVLRFMCSVFETRRPPLPSPSFTARLCS
jgi:hypothetical protein